MLAVSSFSKLGKEFWLSAYTLFFECVNVAAAGSAEVYVALPE